LGHGVVVNEDFVITTYYYETATLDHDVRDAMWIMLVINCIRKQFPWLLGIRKIDTEKCKYGTDQAQRRKPQKP
jgi:hypothetical protein